VPTGTRDEVIPFLDHNAKVVEPFLS
jgi:hypothetical protein